MSDNPYQPPVTANCFDERLIFSGVIESKDYIELLPVSGVERFGWIVFESPVLTVFLSIVITTTVHGAVGKLPLAPVVAVASLLTFIVAFALLQKKYSRQTIAKQQLLRNSDLLGTAEGELSVDGMLFFDGVHHYWFGPNLLNDCKVSRRGVRYQVDRHAYRFLALTARLFQAYDAGKARRLRNAWSKMAHEGKVPDLTLWNRIGQAPEQAISIHFGEVPNETQLHRVSPWISLWELVGYFAMLGTIVSILDVREWTNNHGFTMVGIWFFWMLIWFLLSRVFGSKKPFKTVSQSGWVTPEEFATFNTHSGVRMPTTNLQLRAEDDNLILGTIHSQSIAIERSMLVNPNEWERLCSIAKGG